MIRRSAERTSTATVGSLSCRRPGCGRTSTLSISYDAATCQIWIDDVGSGSAMGQPLCAQHASRLNPPRGWVVVDRRTGSVGGLPGSGPDTPTGESPARGRRQWGRFETPRSQFVRATQAPLAAPRREAVEPVHMTDAFASTVTRNRHVAPEESPSAPPAPAASISEAVIPPEAQPVVSPPAAAVPPPWNPPPVPIPRQPLNAELVEPAAASSVLADSATSVAAVTPSSMPAAPTDAIVETTASPTLEAATKEPGGEDPAEAKRRRLEERRARRRAMEEEADLLKPKGGMLKRAFEATGLQRTVLSAPLGAEHPTDDVDSSERSNESGA